MSRMETVSIHGFAFGGRAIGKRSDGKICFIRGAIPGETVTAEITADRKSYAEGILKQILSPSPARIASSCPNPCPGCSYAHIPYEMELEWKQKQFESFLVRSRLVPRERLLPPLGAQHRLHWRNKLKFALERDANGNPRAGYRADDNLSLIEVRDCPLASEAILAAYRSGEWKRLVTQKDRSLTFRSTEADGVCLFTEHSKNTAEILTEHLGSFGVFQVPESSFFQVNAEMAEHLFQRALSIMERCAPRHLLELYCGCGCFSVLAAERFPGLRADGVEIDPHAVASAKRNAELHHAADRCHFHTGDAGTVMKRLYPKGVPEHTMILIDPPRTGLGHETRELILQSSARYIVYVSCAPDTLARDLKELLAAGYTVLESGLIDMFPSTAHFESVTLLKHVSGVILQD